MLGQLGDPGAVPLGTVGVNRLYPSGLWKFEDCLADRLIERVADREADVRLAAVGAESVRGAADVRPDQDLAIEILGRELRERQPSTVK